MKQLFLGGILPVLAFALVENFYGAKAGLIAGVLFGFGEMAYERVKLGRIQGITLASNALVIVLGGISLFEDNPAFFKLQPAVLTLAFAGFVLVSSFMGKPILVELARKQRGDLPEPVIAMMGGMNFRMGLCLVVIGMIGVHAAFYWSTPAWAAYKAVGAPVMLVLYGIVDAFVMRRRQRGPPPPPP